MKQGNEQQWALNEMAKWLSHSKEFGEKPVEQQIVYQREVSWPLAQYPVEVFLIKYRMKKGFEGIGFTGPTTWSFIRVKNWNTLTLDDLVYCYTGWYIQFFFRNLEGLAKQQKLKDSTPFIDKLIEKGIVTQKSYKVCDVFKVGEDLIYYALETIKDGKAVYLVGTEEDYTFYDKDLPQMQLPPLFYFLGKTFNPFKIHY